MSNAVPNTNVSGSSSSPAEHMGAGNFGAATAPAASAFSRSSFALRGKSALAHSSSSVRAGTSAAVADGPSLEA